MASSKQRDIMDSNPRTGNDNKLPKISDLFNTMKLSTDFKQLRILAGFGSYAMHWIPIKGSKSGKETKIPRVCLNYDSKSDSNDDNGCPYCKLGNKAPTKYLFNVIDRDAQEDLGKKSPKYSSSETKNKFLEPNSKSRSPVYVLQLPPGQVDKLKKYSKLNKVKDKKKGNFEASVTDPAYGIDFNISFDADAKGNNYDIQKSDRTPLTDSEQDYLVWDVESISEKFAPLELDAAKADAKDLKKIMIGVVDDSDSYGSDDSKKKSKNKKSKKEESDLDSDLGSELSSEESESESEAPKKKNKKSKKEESDLDSDLSSEESESDTKKKSKKKKSKKNDSELSSEESESELSSEESDSDIKRKSSKKKSKKEESESDLDSDLNSEESESESEAPKKKKRK